MLEIVRIGFLRLVESLILFQIVFGRNLLGFYLCFFASIVVLAFSDCGR